MFPQEIMLEILVRLPPKSIGRFRCVSKQWRHLLSELHFIKSHLHQTKLFLGTNELLMLIFGDTCTLYSASIVHPLFDESTAFVKELCFVVHPDFGIEGMPSCDGLILIMDDKFNRLLVNPITKECRKLPISPYALDPRNSFIIYGLGYDHVNDDYKVVTLSYYFNFETDDDAYDEFQFMYDCTEMFVNVYSVRNGTWKRVENSPFDHSLGRIFSGGFLGGCLHWIANRTSDKSSVVVGFDLTKEKFNEVPVPSSIDGENFMFDELVVLEGCLWLCHSNSKNQIHVWVMKEYGVKQSWTEIAILEHGVSRYRPLLCNLGQRKVVMVKDENSLEEKLVVYDLDSGTFKDLTFYNVIDRSWISNDVLEFYIGGDFIETLVSPYYNPETQRE